MIVLVGDIDGLLIPTADSLSSHFSFVNVSDVEISVIIHGQSQTIDVADENFSFRCTMPTRPSHDSPIVSITDNKAIRSFFNQYIARFAQLISSAPSYVATRDYFSIGILSLSAIETRNLLQQIFKEEEHSRRVSPKISIPNLRQANWKRIAFVIGVSIPITGELIRKRAPLTFEKRSKNPNVGRESLHEQ